MLDFFKKKSISQPFKRDTGRSPLEGLVAEEARKKGKYDWKDAPLSVTEIAAICLDVAFGAANGGNSNGYASLANQAMQSGQSGSKAKNGSQIKVPANPLFVGHGHSTGDVTLESPLTLKYLQRRRYKEVGGTGVSIAGSAAVIGSLGHLPVNPISIAKQASASMSTMAHLTKLKLLAAAVDAEAAAPQRGMSLSELIGEVIKVKVHKSGIQGTKLATASVPVLGEIITAGVNGGINAGIAAAKVFDKAYHARHCANLAMELHWRAYQEQFEAYCRMHRIEGDFFSRENYLAHPRPPRLTGKNLKAANETLRDHARPPRLTGMGLKAAREALEAANPPANRKPSADFRATVLQARQSFYFNREAGHASRIVNELFTRRSALMVLGRHDVGAFVMEPGGWVAIADKIASL